MAIELRRKGFASQILGVESDPVNAAAAEKVLEPCGIAAFKAERGARSGAFRVHGGKLHGLRHAFQSADAGKMRRHRQGKSAHAGNNPWDGRNANVAAMKFALAAYELADAELGTTVNPGVLKGGSAPNVISDTCEVQIDIRYWKDEDGRALKAKIEELVGQTWVEGVTQTMRVDCFGPAMPLSEDTKELVAKITEAAKLEGFDAQWVDAGGGSDGNHIAKEGVPVIDGCAPAGGAFHSDREFLRLDTVEERIRMVTRFLTLI